LPSRKEALITRTSSIASSNNSDIWINAAARSGLSQGSVASTCTSRRFLLVLVIHWSICATVSGCGGSLEYRDIGYFLSGWREGSPSPTWSLGGPRLLRLLAPVCPCLRDPCQCLRAFVGGNALCLEIQPHACCIVAPSNTSTERLTPRG